MPDWPEFSNSADKAWMMELGDNVGPIPIPNQEKLDLLRTVLKPAYRRRYLASKLPGQMNPGA